MTTYQSLAVKLSLKSVQIQTPLIKTVDTFISSDVNTQNHNTQMHDSDEGWDSFALEKSPSVDEREKLSNLQSVMSTLAYNYAMYNSLRTEKHRMSISKGNLEHPSKAYVNFMINDQTSTEQINRIREEGYNSNDLFHLKDEGWIKEFQ